MTDRGRRLAAATSAGALNAAGALPLYLTGALAVQLREALGSGRAALGAAVAVFLGAAAIASAPLGRLAERLGAARAMRVAGTVTAAVLLGIALTARTWPVLGAWLVLGGLALSLGESACNLALSRAIRPGRLGLAFGIKQGAIPVGSLAAGIAVPAIALRAGWTWAFAAAAGAALLAVAAVRTVDAAVPAPPADPTRRSPTRTLVLLSVGSGTAFAAATSLGTFFVDGAVSAGVPPGRAGLLLAAGSVAAVLVRLSSGGLADRHRAGHLAGVAVLLLGGIAGYLLLASAAAPLLPLGALLAFGLGWGWPSVFFYAVTRANAAAAGTANGVVLTGGFLGSLSGPLLLGVLIDSAGYRVAWLVAAVLALVAIAAMLAGQRRLEGETTKGMRPCPSP